MRCGLVAGTWEAPRRGLTSQLGSKSLPIHPLCLRITVTHLQGAEGLIVGHGRDGTDDAGLGVTTQRVLQDAGQFAIPIVDEAAGEA